MHITRKRAARALRAVAVLGVSLAVTLGLASAPAHAASQIYAYQSITVPGLVRHQIDVHLEMSQSDAQGYINNGARIEIWCYGDDPLFDHVLGGVPGGFGNTFTGSPKPGQPEGYGVLKAVESGVHLTTLNLYGVGNELNEDIGFADEVYCKVKWIDGDGATLAFKTNVATGYF